MKEYLLKVLLFFILVAILDVACGSLFNVLKSKARGGQTYKNEYLFNKCEDDILVLGSSKANHHYIPSIITDSLGLTCYNAGEEGCGIIPAYVRYKLVRNRRKPKLVLYEITPGYDYLEDKGGYSGYLGVVRQYADNKDVREMYLDFSDELERYRLLSGMYRNNSCIIKNVKDVIKPAPNHNGYDPLMGTINPKKNRSIVQKTEKTIDSLKLSYLEDLVKETKKDGVPLVFIVSPAFDNLLDNDYAPAMELCRKYNVPFLDSSGCDLFAGKVEYFQDYTHLNQAGAVAYTQYIVPQLMNVLNNQ